MQTKKNQKTIEPLRKSHNRWAWMAGAAAAASPAAHAATAQITLLNNTADNTSGLNISLMVTTGHAFGSVRSQQVGKTGGGHFFAGASGTLHGGNNIGLTATHANGNFHAAATGFIRQTTTGGSSRIVKIRQSGVTHNGPTAQKAFFLFPFTLSDPTIPGAPSNAPALLEAEAFNQSATDQTVALLAVFYPTTGNTTPNLTVNSSTGAISGSYTNVGSSNNGVFTPAAAPEPSGLGLLALGAGGILARRQRRKAA